MKTQTELANLFNRLHHDDKPLVLYNVWDVGSARAVAEAGADAIATGSWSVAAAHGYADGEQISLEFVLANAARIAAAVDLPVTVDFEGGYAGGGDALERNIQSLIATGVIGINFEDGIVGGAGLYSLEEQVKRLATVRGAADRSGIPLFINARTDLFLNADPAEHRLHLQEALERATAYASASVDGLFAPGLCDEELIRELCESVSLPVNVMVPPAPPPSRLSALGVARVSYGPAPFGKAMDSITAAAADALAKS